MKLHHGSWIKWLSLWVVFTVIFSFTLRPRPVLELPHRMKYGHQVGVGFTEDNKSFLTMEVVDDDWRFGKLTAWDIGTGRSSERGMTQRAARPVEWKFDHPLGLDGLVFKKLDKVWQVLEGDTQRLLHSCGRGDAQPVLARWSPDRRWLAVEWKNDEIDLIDLAGRQPGVVIAKEGIIQFSADSSCLLTSSQAASRNRQELYGLNAWSVAVGRKRWANADAPAPAIRHYLMVEQGKSSFNDFKFGGGSHSTGVTYGSDKEFYPVLFGAGQAFVKQTRQEWPSPIAEWLNKNAWYGFGSGRFWTELVVVDLASGSIVSPGPLRSIQGMETLASADGRLLAMQVRDRAPWYDRWVIYQLPIRRQYEWAMGYGAAVVVGMMVVKRVWRGWKRWRASNA